MRAVTPTVQLFGQFSISCRSRTIDLGIAGVTRELLAYLLATANRPTRRDTLTEMFWEDVEFAPARAALNTAVWRINRLLRPLRGLTMVSTPDTIRIEAAPPIRIDTRLIETALRAVPPAGRQCESALPDPVRAGLVDAAAAYHGPFFDGCSNNWAIVEREKFTSIYLRILSCLARDCEMQHDYEQALEYARQILAIDPFREQVQCEVMWLCVLVGQRVRALAQYKEYQSLLAQELAIQPMAETRALFELIQSDRFSAHRPPSVTGLCSGHPMRSVMAAIEKSIESGYRNVRPRFS